RPRFAAFGPAWFETRSCTALLTMRVEIRARGIETDVRNRPCCLRPGGAGRLVSPFGIARRGRSAGQRYVLDAAFRQALSLRQESARRPALHRGDFGLQA